MATGQTNLTRNMNNGKKAEETVPQFVNSSLDILLGTTHPRKRQVKSPPMGKNICPVTKSNMSKRLFPKNTSHSLSPSESEHRQPNTQHATVTIVAALSLVSRNSS